MSGKDHLFRAVVQNPGTPDARKGHVITCTIAGCTSELFITASGVRGPGGLPTDAVIRKATQAGWLMRRHGRSRVCPTCQAPAVKPEPKAARGVSKPVTPDQRPRIVVPLDPDAPVHIIPPEAAAWIAGPAAWEPPTVGDFQPSAALEYLPPVDGPAIVTRLDGHAGTLTTTLAEQPKEPLPMGDTATPALKRAINAELHRVHEGDAGYSGDWSDRKLAQLLDCSPAAVAAIRAEFFGPDTNEEHRRAADARAKELAAIRQQLVEGAAKVDQSMATLAEADRLYADALARLANLEGN